MANDFTFLGDEDGDTDDGGLDWDEPWDDEDSLDYWAGRCSLVGDTCLSAGTEECDFDCPFNPMNEDDEDDEFEAWDDGDDAA